MTRSNKATIYSKWINDAWAQWLNGIISIYFLPQFIKINKVQAFFGYAFVFSYFGSETIYEPKINGTHFHPDWVHMIERFTRSELKFPPSHRACLPLLISSKVLALENGFIPLESWRPAGRHIALIQSGEPFLLSLQFSTRKRDDKAFVCRGEHGKLFYWGALILRLQFYSSEFLCY